MRKSPRFESPCNYITKIENKLNELSERKILVPLGTITGFMREDQNLAEHCCSDSFACKNAITSLYDTRFSKRFDYRAWRILTENQEEKRIDHPIMLKNLLWSGLDDSDPIVVWGTFVLLACLRKWQEQVLLPDIADILCKAEGQLHNNFPPIQGIEIECALVSMRFKFYHQTFNYRVYDTVCPPVVIDELVNTFCSTLRQIDPSWVPGENLNFDSIKITKLITYRSYDIAPNIATSFYQLRSALSFSYEELNEKTKELLSTFALCMRTSWYVQRSLRTEEEKRQSKGKNNHNRNIDKLKSDEYGILHSYIHSLRDAGEYRKASAYSWYFLQTLPVGYENKSQFRRFPQNLASSIRQAGLTVDSGRYPERNNISNSRIVCKQTLRNDSDTCDDTIFTSTKQQPPTLGVGQTSDQCDLMALSQTEKVDYSNKYRLLDKKRLEQHPDWVILLNKDMNPEEDVWNSFIYWLNKPPSNKEIQECLVRLALEFGQIKSAAIILSNMDVPPVELALQFSNTVCKQCMEFPLALDKRVLELWLKTAQSIFKSQTYTEEQCAALHAGLKAQLFTSNWISPAHLVEKIFDLQLTYKKTQLFGPHTGSIRSISPKRFLGEEHKSVYVSIVNMEGNYSPPLKIKLKNA